MITLRASYSGTVYCYRSCLWRRVLVAGGRCPNLTTASARSVCVSLSAFFHCLLQLWTSGFTSEDRNSVVVAYRRSLCRGSKSSDSITRWTYRRLHVADIYLGRLVLLVTADHYLEHYELTRYLAVCSLPLALLNIYRSVVGYWYSKV